MIILWEVLGSLSEELGAGLGLRAVEKASLSYKITRMQKREKCRKEVCWLSRSPEYISNRQVSYF